MIGAHVTQAWSPPPDDDPARLANLSPRDKAALDAFQHYADNEASYGTVLGQQPQTLADSPVGARVERSSHARPERRRSAHTLRLTTRRRSTIGPSFVVRKATQRYVSPIEMQVKRQRSIPALQFVIVSLNPA